ncbi:hypothetical protein KJ365_00340 [Glaciecola sp. XM2]|jgi:hypothetical protein|uniref:hypothetical protein n=1 Tax=Glaciecola sp. XM2 TaxID=1914931 RepID=UPI001BDEAA1B|nr:hypothetical protein [Glaciecola sp. XM2]MBT1449313.1 hypothetical protein [Glaciecola sp. XM2]
MKLALPFFIVALLWSQLALSQDMLVNGEQLGQLKQETAPITAIKTFSGSPVIAEVISLPGQAYVLTSPMNVQQIQYLAGIGQALKKGEKFAVLRGPEVHHYHSQYQIYKRLHTQSKALYENNQKLFNSKAINEGAWLQISQQYYDVKLAYDEYVHFFEYVSNFDDDTESLTLVAPINGIVSYEATQSTEMGHILARFIPRQSLVFKLRIPFNDTREIASIDAPQCKLTISSVNQQLDGYYQTAWSEPLKNNCKASLGASVSVTPHYKTDAYLTNKQSVFNWQGDNYIFLKNGDAYRAVKITILGTQQQQYVIQSDSPLTDKSALVSSVSAAQGILMGLGE